MKQASKPFSVLVGKTLQKYSLSKNISIITNRNNYAHGLICQDCGTIPMCKQCDVAINFYKQKNGYYIGLCNYCKTEYPSQSSCNHCQGHNLDFYGYGAQQIQSILSERHSIHANIVDASKLNSYNKISQLTHTGVTIATSLLIHPQHTTDILILLNPDTGLQLPDYNARRNCFLQLYEAIMKHPGKHIIIQSYHCEDRVLLLVCKGKLGTALEQELKQRSLLGYPPYQEICLLLYKDEIESKLFSKIQTLHKEMLYIKEKIERSDISIVATPPLIYKLHGKFRYTILCKGDHLRPFMTEVYEKLEIRKRGFLVDWMPMVTV